MKRRAALRANPARTAEWQRRSRRRLPAKSARKRAEEAAERPVRAAVIARDRGCRLAGLDAGHRCLGPLVKHELRKRSQQRGAALDPDNCVALCWAANGWVEDHPDEAHRLGLVRRAGDGG